MKLQVNNEQKMTEIIFANRNKAYGAYEIRSSYGETVFKSLLFVSLTFLIVFALGYYYTHKTEITNTVVLDQIVPKDIVTVVDIKPEIEIEKPKAKNNFSNISGVAPVNSTKSIPFIPIEFFIVSISFALLN